MAATVTSKGPVTIPKPVRDLLGVEPGSRVDCKQRPSRFARLRGHAGKVFSTDAIMALTRMERRATCRHVASFSILFVGPSSPPACRSLKTKMNQ